MSGPSSVTATNNILTLNDFRQLTVNRDVNKGTLIVRRDAQDPKKIVGLECACHHAVFKSWNKPELITDEMRNDLTDSFRYVVNGALDEIGKTLKDGTAGKKVGAALKNKIDSRIAALKEAFSSVIDGATEKSDLRALPRTVIGNLVVALDELNRFSVEDLETLSVEELKAFASGSWKVGDFNLTDQRTLPCDTDTLNKIAAAIKVFIQEAIPGTKKHAELLDRGETIQALVNQLDYSKFQSAVNPKQWRNEYNKWMTPLRRETLGVLPLKMETELKELFKLAYRHCADDDRTGANNNFEEMKKNLDRLSKEIVKQRETKIRAFEQVTLRNGLDVELEDSMTAVLKLVANHGIKIDKNSVWGLFERLERQEKGDWKIFKELGCSRLDTFIALRNLTKKVRQILADANKPKPVEEKPVEKPKDETKSTVSQKPVDWSKVSPLGGMRENPIEKKILGENPVEVNSDETKPAEEKKPGFAFGGKLRLEYSRDEIGKRYNSADIAFDRSKTVKDRGLALAGEVWTTCRGMHFREAVYHLFNEIAARHPFLSSASDNFSGDYEIEDYLRFLEEFADRFEDDDSSTMGDFYDDIYSELFTTKAWISDDRFRDDMELALDLLCEMYKDQENLQEVDGESLKNYLGVENVVDGKGKKSKPVNVLEKAVEVFQGVQEAKKKVASIVESAS